MRRLFWILVVLLALIAAGDAALWRFATHRLQSGMAEWVSAQRAAGWTIATGSEQTGGWPLRATVMVRDVTIAGGRPLLPQDVSWKADRIVLQVSLLHPAVLQIAAPGSGRLRVAGSTDVACSARQLAVAVPWLGRGPVHALEVRGDTLRVGLPDGTVTIDRLTAHAALSPAAIQGQAGVAVSLDAAGVGLPPQMHWALGPRIASVALDVALDGPLPAEGGIAERATTWRNDGGGLELHRLETAWGPLHLRVTARLGLDAALQPAGTGDARIAGYDATADALAAHGIMAPSAAIAAKAVLSLLAHAPDDGGPSEVDVPLTLRRRTLSMQQIPLLRVPALDWPGQ